MPSKPALRTGPDDAVGAGVLERRDAVSALIGDPGDMLFVSGLAGAKEGPVVGSPRCERMRRMAV